MSQLSNDGVPITPPVGLPDELRELAIRLYYKTDQATQISAETNRRKSTAAARPLRWIAVAQTLNAVVLASLLQRVLANGNPYAIFLLVITIALAASFWGLWAWSLVSPLPAAIVGLLLYTSISIATFTQIPTDSPARYHAGLGPFGLITIILLVIAIIHGARQRALLVTTDTSDASTAPCTRSITSAIFLYLFLLSIVVIPRSLAADHDMDMKDLFDVHKLIAIVVITWAALSWRDVLPAIRRIGSPTWLLLGVLLGLSTFIVASIYGDLISYFLGVPPARISQPFRDAGYSWFTVVCMIAVFPAIFEELSFRGIIIPCLNRVLTTNETIIVSAMMFMILHLSVPKAPPLLLAGIIMGVLRFRSRSIWPGVLMHFTHNAMFIACDRWM